MMANNIYLTSAVDNLKGSSLGFSNFIGTLGGALGSKAPTVNAGDTLTGYGPQNTLLITDQGTTGIPAINLSGIQTVTINSIEGLTLDSSAWKGLTHLVMKTASSDDNITVADKVALSVVATGGNVTTTGGAIVHIKDDAAHAVNVNGSADTTSVKISGSAGGTISDLNYSNSSPNSISKVSLSNSTNTTTIQSNALTSLVVTGANYETTEVVAATSSNRTLNLTMIADAYTVVKDDTATVANIEALTKASTPIEFSFNDAKAINFNDQVGVSFSDGGLLFGANDQSLNISGKGYFYGSFANLASTAVIDATHSSGSMTVAVLGSQSFAAGSGQDMVSLLGDSNYALTQTGMVIASHNQHNEIILQDVAGATEANIAKTLVKNFEVLGVAGKTSGTFNMSNLPDYKAFDVLGSGGNVSFTHVAQDSKFSVVNSDSNTITFQTADKMAVTDHVTLNLGTVYTSSITAANVVFDDANSNGIGAVNIISHGSGVNTLTLGSALTKLHLSGSAGLTLTNLLVNDVIISAGADNANNTFTLGNGSNTVSLGKGVNSITVGTGSNDISYAKHAGGHDTTIVGANASESALTSIKGAVLGDNLKIADATAFDATAITATQVKAAGGNIGQLAGWVNGAMSVLAEHQAGWFKFEGNTYIVEQSAVAGTAFGTGDTLVKLVGLVDLSHGSYSTAATALVL